MLKRRSKKIALLLTLTMLATMIIAVPALAADPVKVSSAYATVGTGDNKAIGTFTVKAGDFSPAVNPEVLYVSIELPAGVKWVADPLVTDLAVTGVAAGASLVSASTTSAEYTVTPAGAETATDLVFTSPNVNIESGFSGDLKPTVTLQNVTGTLTNWTQTATPTLAKVGSGDLTVTAATAKGYSSVPTSGAGAKVTLKENQAGVLTAGQTVVFTIKNSGVTFAAAPADAAAGSGGLDFGAGSLSGSDKTCTWTVGTASSGIAGKYDFNYTLNMAPNVGDGDIIIEVSSDNSKLKDTELVVATVGGGEFTVTGKSVDKKCYLGRLNQDIGSLEIKPSTSFKANGSLEFTLTGAKWAADPVPGDITGGPVWTAGTRYSDDRSLWYVAPANATSTITVALPNIDVDANAVPGDVKVTVTGSAGVEGEYVVGQYVTPITVSAEKPQVVCDALDQAAGVITITEARKDGFTNNGDLLITLPNGVTFSKNPTIYVDGSKKSATVNAGTGKGYGTISWANAQISTAFNNAKIETIEIKDVFYDVDSRFVSKDIVVEVSGLVLTAAGGKTGAIASVANATGVSAKSGSAAFVVGSTAYKVNGVEFTADVAPYIKNDRTYLPVRYVAYGLGINDANILWDQAAQTVTLMKGDKVVQVKIGSKTMLINGAALTMDVAPEIVNDRTMLPLRFIAQAFGATVAWDQATQTASFTF